LISKSIYERESFKNLYKCKKMKKNKDLLHNNKAIRRTNKQNVNDKDLRKKEKIKVNIDSLKQVI